jgi:hypothetical protein
VGEVVIIASRGGGRTTAAVLTFEDYLAVRLRAVSTVRCWQQPWLADLVRRCETAGVAVDGRVTRELPDEAREDGRGVDGQAGRG